MTCTYVLVNREQNPAASAAGRSHMLWGIIGMAIMFGVFGIIGFIARTVGADAIL